MALCGDMLRYRRHVAISGVMERYEASCCGMWLYVTFVGVMWRYVALCGVIWRDVALCDVMWR